MRYLVLVLMLALLAAPALAGPPTLGTYTPNSGYFSESWPNSPYNDGVVGNTIHAYDNTLGTQWIVECGSIINTTLVENAVDVNGDGYRIYSTDYVNGTLWLSGGGPWGDGSQDYMADALTFNVASTHLFAGGTRYAVRSNVTLIAKIRGFVNCVEYTLTNAAIEGSTEMGMTLPAGYPAFMDPDDCTTGAITLGAWGSATQVSLSIFGDCTVPTRDATWGQIKSMYRD